MMIIIFDNLCPLLLEIIAYEGSFLLYDDMMTII